MQPANEIYPRATEHACLRFTQPCPEGIDGSYALRYGYPDWEANPLRHVYEN
jgi:hypothetical protein